ncbi:MAG: hypothetical protein ABH868_04655 [bacterium]
MGKKTLALVLLVGMLVINFGCSRNFYQGLHKDTDTVEEHIAKGNIYLDKGEPANAKGEFDKALAKDPYNAEALYGHSKATVREGLTIDFFDLAKDFTDTQVSGYLLDYSITDLQSIYDVSTVVRQDLEKIALGQTHGSIGVEDVYIDLGMALALEGISYMLLKADELKLLLDTDGFRLENLDELSADDINDMIDTINTLLPQAQDYIEEVLTDQADQIEQTITDVLANINKYKVELGVDNDEDGTIDEEYLNGIDDDGDGLIDEDSTGTAS